MALFDSALFDSAFLKRLEVLSLMSKRLFGGQLLARRRAMRMGEGVEFADHRDYAPGDDFRYVDWNIYARHGDLLLKRFQEEEDLHVYLFLDCSRSMSFGNPTKFDYARQVAAALGYIALADLDRVSVVAFANRIVDTLPLMRGKQQILTLLSFLNSLDVQRNADTDLNRVAREFLACGNRTGLAIITSDLFDPNGFQRGTDALRHRQYEPTLIHVYDHEEANPNVLGDVALCDMETDLQKKVTINERNLREYRSVFAKFLQSVTTYSRSYGLSCTQTTTNVPFDDLILHMMRKTSAVG